MEREGVIKYDCTHKHQALPWTIPLGELNGWRSLMLQLGMIGQSPERYAGLGFGNISQRASTLITDPLFHCQPLDSFIISGTQTGHLPSLKDSNISLVEQAEPEHNRLISRGLIAPSSEALSHAVIYQQRPDCSAVVHVHCPIIWAQAKALELPCSAADIPYGTPQMAAAIADLVQDGGGIIAMLGHEDGIISYATSLEQASLRLVRYQVLASQLSAQD